MSIFTKKEIIESMKDGGIEFDPAVDRCQLQPHSIDLRLGYNFYIPKRWVISEKGRVGASFDYLDSQNPQNNFDLIKIKPGQYFEILPKEFVIASSLERVNLKKDNLMAHLDARSSLLRRGLLIAGGVVEAKYQGTLTFPIVNNTNDQVIRLYPGERVCSLLFQELISSVSSEEAKLHGISEAKYSGSTPYGLESRSDSEEEISLIKAGKVSELKEKFKIG